MGPETARIVLGAGVAAAAAWSLPGVQRRWWTRALTAALLAGWALWPVLPGVGSIVLLGAIAAVASVPTATRSTRSGRATGDARALDHDVEARLAVRVTAGVCLTLVLGIAAAVVAVGGHETWDATVRWLRDRDQVVVYTAGGLAATVVAGSVIAVLLRPFQVELAARGESLASLRNAGRYIGWLERSIFFALFVTGQPAAAALALTAKSIARFPSLPEHKEGFAEYFLIGTLLSLALARAAAACTRLALGLSVFG